MSNVPDPDEPSTKLEALRVTLEMAAVLAGEIATDEQLSRLIQSFQTMPPADRGVLVDVIEREVQARRLSRATEDVTGQSMHPNPNARLYVRAHDGEPTRFELERDEMMIAALRAMRVTPILTVPAIHGEWIEAMRAALQHLDAPTRGVVATLARELLVLIADAGGPLRVPVPAEPAVRDAETK